MELSPVCSCCVLRVLQCRVFRSEALRTWQYVVCYSYCSTDPRSSFCVFLSVAISGTLTLPDRRQNDYKETGGTHPQQHGIKQTIFIS
jgi:hypothetical protein